MLLRMLSSRRAMAPSRRDMLEIAAQLEEFVLYPLRLDHASSVWRWRVSQSRLRLTASSRWSGSESRWSAPGAGRARAALRALEEGAGVRGRHHLVGLALHDEDDGWRRPGAST